MAIHNSISSLLKESLREYLYVSDYCINYKKDMQIWGSNGCFGYPSLVLLMAIADAIGTYVIGGNNVEKHFDILNHPDYYNLGLTDDELKLVYKHHRCLLTHNAALSYKAGLSIGSENDKVTEHRDGILYINLKPFLLLSKNVVNNFLNNSDKLVQESNQEFSILNK